MHPYGAFARRLPGRTAVLGVLLLASAGPGAAATAVGQLQVSVTITAECQVSSTAALSFGSHGVLAAALDATGTITVQCTDTTPYDIALGPGTGAGATIAARKLTGSGGATITYGLYRDAARTQAWGETIDSDTQAGTGDGTAQSFTVYGRIPAQTTPVADTYQDDVAITVTY
jgi:spore coat protein U-like protein